MHDQITQLRTWFHNLTSLEAYFLPPLLKQTFNNPVSTPFNLIRSLCVNLDPKTAKRFEGLRQFTQIPAYQACISLHRLKALTEQNFNRIANHPNPRAVIYALSALEMLPTSYNGFLSFTPANISTSLIRHLAGRDANSESARFKLLQTPANISAVLTHSDPNALAEAFKSLCLAGLLTIPNPHSRTEINPQVTQNFNALLNHTNLRTITRILKLLEAIQLLQPDMQMNSEDAQQHFDQVMRHPHTEILFNILNKAYGIRLFEHNPTLYFYQIMVHYDPQNLLAMFHVLEEHNLFTEFNLTRLMNLRNLSDLIQAVSDMIPINSRDSSNQQLLNQLLEHSNPRAVAAVYPFYAAGLLDEHHYTKVKALDDPSSVIEVFQELAGLNMPPHQAVYHAVLDHENPTDLLNLIRQLTELELLQPGSFPAVLHASALLKRMLESGLFHTPAAPINFNTALGLSNSEAVMNVLSCLYAAGLTETPDDTETYFQVIIAHPDAYAVGDVLIQIYHLGLLGPENAHSNLAALKCHNHPDRVAEGLRRLKDEGLLNYIEEAQANFNAMIVSQEPIAVAEAFIEANRAGLLNTVRGQCNRLAITLHSHPRRLAVGLAYLNASDFLNDENSEAVFNSMVASEMPHDFAQNYIRLITLLKMQGLDTREYTDNLEIFNHQQTVNAIIQLNQAGIPPVPVACMKSHSNPKSLAKAFIQLSSTDLLNSSRGPANRQALTGHAHLDAVNYLIKRLSALNLLRGPLAQSNFHSILCHAHLLAGDAELIDSLQRLPQHLFTQERWFRMIALCAQNQANPNAAKQVLIDYVTETMNEVIVDINTQIQGMEPTGPQFTPVPDIFPAYTPEVRPVLRQRGINGAQSTHTASVHKSASESARRLLARYGHLIDTPGKLLNHLDQIRQWIRQIPGNTFINQRVKLGIEGVLNRDMLDERSGIRFPKLLALAWIAIHDEELRTGTLEDVKGQLIQGFYECRRGYNLSETGVDDRNPEDRAICGPGHFNKILEKLHGIVADVNIIYVTDGMAAIKFLIVVKEEYENYLRSRANPQTAGEFVRVVDLLNQSQDLEFIYPCIKQRIVDRMFDEFGILYTGKEDPVFMTLIDTGIYATVRVPSFQKMLYESNGYAQYCQRSRRNSLGLFSGMCGRNRQAPAVAEPIDLNAMVNL